MPSTLSALKDILDDDSLEFESHDCVASTASGKRYFYKSTSVSGEQYNGEAESLRLLGSAAPGLAPHLVSCQETGKDTIFLSEYIDLDRGLKSKDFDELAKRLALEVHQKESTNGFGFGVPSYCGATRIVHGWYHSWADCYSNMIAELLTQLRTQGSRYQNLCDKGQRLQERAIPVLLGNLSVRPVLLHGDLWSGNVALDRKSQRPMIYDPASYYGHNEADLAIARIFGGFPESFFVAYHQHLPKIEPAEQYTVRQNLYEVFHYLNHTLLFEGGYAQSADHKMQQVLDFVSQIQS